MWQHQLEHYQFLMNLSFIFFLALNNFWKCFLARFIIEKHLVNNVLYIFALRIVSSLNFSKISKDSVANYSHFLNLILKTDFLFEKGNTGESWNV